MSPTEEITDQNTCLAKPSLLCGGQLPKAPHANSLPKNRLSSAAQFDTFIQFPLPLFYLRPLHKKLVVFLLHPYPTLPDSLQVLTLPSTLGSRKKTLTFSLPLKDSLRNVVLVVTVLLTQPRPGISVELELH